jgi:hypothetical protein
MATDCWNALDSAMLLSRFRSQAPEESNSGRLSGKSLYLDPPSHLGEPGRRSAVARRLRTS